MRCQAHGFLEKSWITVINISTYTVNREETNTGFDHQKFISYRVIGWAGKSYIKVIIGPLPLIIAQRHRR